MHNHLGIVHVPSHFCRYLCHTQPTRDISPGNIFLQISQGKNLSPRWTTRSWRLKWQLWVKTLLHRMHLQQYNSDWRPYCTGCNYNSTTQSEDLIVQDATTTVQHRVKTLLHRGIFTPAEIFWVLHSSIWIPSWLHPDLGTLPPESLPSWLHPDPDLGILPTWIPSWLQIDPDLGILTTNPSWFHYDPDLCILPTWIPSWLLFVVVFSVPRGLKAVR